jgi:hypothetical protein
VILDVRTIDGHGWFRQRIESRHAVFDVLDLLAFFGVTIPFGIASARPPLERFSAGGTYCFFGFDFHIFMSLMPNQSPEPTGIVAFFLFASDFISSDATHCRWLSLDSLGIAAMIF